jgi:hypothetical protein
MCPVHKAKPVLKVRKESKVVREIQAPKASAALPDRRATEENLGQLPHKFLKSSEEL